MEIDKKKNKEIPKLRKKEEVYKEREKKDKQRNKDRQNLIEKINIEINENRQKMIAKKNKREIKLQKKIGR